jgi:hypothetical protein
VHKENYFIKSENNETKLTDYISSKEEIKVVQEGRQVTHVPKKIIKKMKPQFSSNFKTHPEGTKLNSDLNIIDHSTTGANQSAYNKNRKFKNENLPHNQIYFFSYSDNYHKIMESNVNLIFRKK